MHFRSAAVAQIALVVACADRPTPPVAPQTGGQVAPMSSAIAAPESPPDGIAPSTPDTPFVAVASVAGALDVCPDPDRVFVTTAGRVIGEIRGEAYVDRPELAIRPSFVPPGNAAALVGVTAGEGQSLYASWAFAEGRTGATMLAKWDGKAWLDLRVRSVNASGLSDPVRWTRGRVVALETPSMGAIGPRSDIVWVDGPKKDLPRLPKRQGKQAGCRSWILASNLTAMPNGELWVLGTTCPATFQAQNDYALPVVHRFAEDGRDLGLIKLPFPAKNLDGTPFVPPSAGDTPYELTMQVSTSEGPTARVAVSAGEDGASRSWIATFDGTQWKAEMVSRHPASAGPASSEGVFELRHARSDDQTTEEDQLWHTRADGPPTRIPLPRRADGRPVQVVRFWSRGPGDLWLVATTAEGTLFYRTKAGAPALSGLPAIDAHEKPAKPTRAGPLTKTCPTIFVLLYTLAKTAPADFDFPATRAALKGHGELEPSLAFIEFERGGQRFFGAHAANVEVAQTVAKLVKEKVPGSSPAVVCDDPEPLRKLSIDLTTGKMR